MKVFLIGGSGQLGGELRKTAPKDVSIEAPESSELTVTDRQGVDRAVEIGRPELVINASAYTAVDDAESDRETAFAVNADGARTVARAAAAVGARLIHVSTDFVFDGGQSLPYLPTAVARPLGVYGESKLAGEVAVLDELPGNSLVIRTSWLYSADGHNFVKTMLRLFAERKEVRVVMDQIGCPTWARNLASAIWRWSTLPTAIGVRHYCDAGIASWYDFAMAIHRIGSKLGLLGAEAVDTVILPIRSAMYPTPARRPASSVLDSFDSWSELEMTPLHWQDSLQRMLSELKASGVGESTNA